MGNYHEFLYSDEGFTTHREIWYNNKC
jgi:hypothetical protein